MFFNIFVAVGQLVCYFSQPGDSFGIPSGEVVLSVLCHDSLGVLCNELDLLVCFAAGWLFW